MTRPLFDIGADLLRVRDVIDNPPEGIPEGMDMPAFDGTSDLLREWFDSLKDEEAAKLDNYVGLIKTLEMEAVAAQAEAEQWKAKAESRKRRIEWLKERLLSHLVATGRDKVTTATGRVIAAQANGGKEPLLMHEGTTDVPAEFIILVPTVDKEKVRKKLEAGEVLEFAQLGERGRHLRIR